MVPIAVPSVGMPSMLPAHAQRIDLSKVLYIYTMPYIATNWKSSLDLCNISVLFPDLINNLTYSSPIGNPPHLLKTFLPHNLPLADLHPDIIDSEIMGEVTVKQMSGPSTVDQAHAIFGSNFCMSPVGLKEKVLGDGKWHMIHHLSKHNSDNLSTNSWLDCTNFTVFYSASMVASFVSPPL